MRHLTSINQKAKRIEALHENDVVALQGAPPAATGPFIPMGCSFVFAPGWEVDSTGGTAGLCQPVERDLFDCHLTCFWPAHVPDLTYWSMQVRMQVQGRGRAAGWRRASSWSGGGAWPRSA